MNRILITGSSGLIGSECVRYWDGKGWEVHGTDNNMRMSFFGPDGDTSANLFRLESTAKNFTHHGLDIRSAEHCGYLVDTIKPQLIIHAAAQPSHDFAAKDPSLDWDVNATGTHNMLEAARKYAPEATFVFLSTNKVYGDAPNELPVRELQARFDYVRNEDWCGVRESMRIDRSTHSLFGVSKLAADVLVQEYGCYFGMKTVCFRAGCLTGPAHAAAELHGFLAYLVRCLRENRRYRIIGHRGKQVRDNLHAYDVCRAIEAFHAAPRPGEVYNLGGGRDNSVSVIEAIGMAERLTGRDLEVEFVDTPRVGDHVCYITDTAKFQSHYPAWKVTRNLDAIFNELTQAAPTPAPAVAARQSTV